MEKALKITENDFSSFVDSFNITISPSELIECLMQEESRRLLSNATHSVLGKSTCMVKSYDCTDSIL